MAPAVGSLFLGGGVRSQTPAGAPSPVSGLESADQLSIAGNLKSGAFSPREFSLDSFYSTTQLALPASTKTSQCFHGTGAKEAVLFYRMDSIGTLEKLCNVIVFVTIGMPLFNSPRLHFVYAKCNHTVGDKSAQYNRLQHNAIVQPYLSLSCNCRKAGVLWRTNFTDYRTQRFLHNNNRRVASSVLPAAYDRGNQKTVSPRILIFDCVKALCIRINNEPFKNIWFKQIYVQHLVSSRGAKTGQCDTTLDGTMQYSSRREKHRLSANWFQYITIPGCITLLLCILAL